MGHVTMGRMIWITGLVYALCAMAAGSLHPDHWSGFVQAVMLVIAGSTILMNIESDIAHNLRAARPARRPAARLRPAA
ncbi:hypothetical protein [Novosphingobium sp.]|uniref:hypothetical protein n=1 Tax=Novosphingobium sp. TaxID=1874826 RepID=UPI0025F43B1E|nr:hypothetical protein [Novosphingobium sp.]